MCIVPQMRKKSLPDGFVISMYQEGDRNMCLSLGMESFLQTRCVV